MSSMISSLQLSSVDEGLEERMAEQRFYETINDLSGMHGNNFTVALVGYPNSGKTSMFNLLCERDESVDESLYTTLDPNVGQRRNKDERLDWLCQVLKPPRVTQQFTVFIDTPALSGGAHIGNGLGDSVCEYVEGVTAIALVVRAFDDDDLTHIEESIDPCRDVKALDQELKVHDLQMIEDAIQNGEKVKVPSREVKHKLATLYKAWGVLNGEDYGDPKERSKYRQKVRTQLAKGNKVFRSLGGLALRLARWEPREADVLAELRLLTVKPLLFVPNLSARDYNRKDDYWSEQLLACIDELGGGPLVRFSCTFEERLNTLRLQGKLRKYMAANPMHITACDDLSTSLQKSMDLIRIYEIGSFEKCLERNTSEHVRCFYSRNNLNITEAAALVHSNYARLFSFVQVLTYGDLYEVKGDLADVKTEGKIRTQGTKYTVGDGDLIDFSLCTMEYRLKFQKKVRRT